MKFQYPSAWIAAARDGLARLADRPLVLFVVLFTINALSRPYLGITHDTRLYSGQVLNHVEDGAYADDLFFRYGSQDQYSLFSRLAAPLVQVMGLPAGFFVLYLISKSLLIWGMMRLVQTLIPDKAAAVLALAFCMVVSVRYAGLQMLNVHESFLTPRMLSIALVLFALDFLVRGLPIASLAVLLAALAIHPLMAFGGLLVWSAFSCWTYLGPRVFAGVCVAGAAGAALVLAYEPFGIRLFGEMDDTWRQTILYASTFNFPSHWTNEDWRFLAIQFAIGGVVAWKYQQLDKARARFTMVLLLVTAIGTLFAILAEQLPFALLLQGQPYRSLWILGFLHLAFAFWLFVDWSQSESPWLQLAGAGMLFYLACNDALTMELICPILVWPFFILALRGMEHEPRDPAWLPHSMQMSVITGAVFWFGYKLLVLVMNVSALNQLHPELRDLMDVFLRNTGPAAMLIGLAWFLVRVGPHLSGRAVFVTAMIGIAIQGAFFAFPETDVYRERYSRYRADLRDVRATIQTERGNARTLPTVYCSLGCLEYVWVDLHAQSYFDWWQAGGYMFRRDMAMEGQRRAGLVAPFEVEKYRKNKVTLNDGDKEVIGRFFKIDFDSVHLQASDLARLCQEPGLDYLVIEQEFDGIYASKHGRLFLYRCQQVRTAMGLPEPETRVASR